MPLDHLRSELSDEVSSILDSEFSITITETASVPHSGDATITFPNLDAATQGAKLIKTCVLYIDMRRSTDLNFSHRPHTVAKLYSAFVRAMTRTARYYGGHVRGIIGDRVMVLFDANRCFENAVNCAIAMNTISEHIINKHFKANEVKFGIGVDYGKMLATKTGIRRHGEEQGNYRNLVWLGRPANVASKLTDVANKPGEYVTVPRVSVGFQGQGPFGGGLSGALPLSMGGILGLGAGALSPFAASSLASASGGNTERTWKTESLESFISQLDVRYLPTHLVHKHPDFSAFYMSDETLKTREATPPILMTSAVWQGFRKAKPNDVIVQKPLFKNVDVKVPGYNGSVYGGNVIFPKLK
jgi:adenylate cyclase